MKTLMILFMVLSAMGVPAAQSGRMPIAVADLEATGVRASDAKTLTNQLHAELFRTGIFDILERQEMATVLREQGFQQAGCVSTECIVEMGQLVGVRQIVAGSIGKLGGKYILNVRMVDVGTGRVLATGSEECTCPLEDLTSAIEKVALTLSGVERRERITVKFSRNGSVKEKGNLYIKSVPSGARVWLDGRAVDGNTPMVIEDIPVDTGRVRLLLESGDYAADTLIRLGDNEFKTIHATLSKKQGRLRVYSNVVQADVYLNDKFKGKAPLFVDSLAVGEYTVTIKKQGYIEQSRAIRAEFRKETVLDFELKKPGPLKVMSIPLEAEIVIDGEKRGVTPAVITGLAPGGHTVEIEKTGYLPWYGKIQMMTGNETKLEPLLKSANGQSKPLKKAGPDDNDGKSWDKVVKWIIIGTGAAFVAAVVLASVN